MRTRSTVLAAAVGVALVTGGAWGVTRAGSSDAMDANRAREQGFRESATSLTPAVRQTVDGSTWSAGTFTNQLGEPCAELRSPYGWRAGGCPRSDWLLRSKLDPNVGGTPESGWVFGLAAPDVATVRLVRSDCTTDVASVAESVFLFVLPTDALQRGIRPYKLQALDREGAVIEAQLLGGTFAKRASAC